MIEDATSQKTSIFACQTMLTLNCFNVTVRSSNPQKIQRYYRRLQHHKTCGHGHIQYYLAPLRTIISIIPPSPTPHQNTNAMRPNRYNGAILRSKSMTYPHHLTTIDERTFHGERTEPEYMEIVNQTAENMRSAVREYIAQCIQEYQVDHHLYRIKLVGILATKNICRTPPDRAPITSYNFHPQYDDDTHGNEQYSEQIATCCARDGIVYETWRVAQSRDALEWAIEEANNRKDVHGVLIFYPLVDKLVNCATTSDRIYKNQETGVYYRSIDDYFRDLVDCGKDVEGYCRSRLRVLTPGGIRDNEFADETFEAETVVGPIYPCTALAVYKVLESLQSPNDDSSRIDVSGKDRPYENKSITIINRSEVLGLPLASMLSAQGATVYSIDKDSILVFLPNGKVRRERTATLEQCVRNSAVVVSGVPSITFKVPTDWISTNATVINVAVESNFDEETLRNGIRGIKYVPHVGRVTVAALEYNLMRLHRQAQMCGDTDVHNG